MKTSFMSTVSQAGKEHALIVTLEDCLAWEKKSLVPREGRSGNWSEVSQTQKEKHTISLACEIQEEWSQIPREGTVSGVPKGRRGGEG